MIWIWIAFIAFVLLILALDLGVFHDLDLGSRDSIVIFDPGLP
jgi:hypothetical protein